MKTSNKQVILIQCSDEKGLVYRISEELYRRELNIISNAEIVDRSVGRFYMRTAFTGECEPADLLHKLKALLPEGAQVEFFSPEAKKLLLYVTKESHCLGDLLLRCQSGELNAQIVGVVSQYEHLKALVEQFSIPFHCVPVGDLSREEHDADLIRVSENFSFDYIVLAKYMRILGAAFVEKFRHRVVNIHHSFLPAFIGANPYRQAFERGVKIIGATAHYVTEDLDEGPIITQAVTNVKQGHDYKQMAREGREIERSVLSKALRLIADNRVILHKNRTLVFE